MAKPTKKNIQKMEIWWVNLTDDTIGTETQKQRPCIVIKLFPEGELGTVIPCTTNLAAKRFPFTYELKSTSANKLPHDSIALIFQVRSLNTKRFVTKQGKLKEKRWIDIMNLLKEYLELSDQ